MFFVTQLQLESLPAMVAGVWSDDRNVQLDATTQFRKLLSIGLILHLLYAYDGVFFYPFFSFLLFSFPPQVV